MAKPGVGFAEVGKPDPYQWLISKGFLDGPRGNIGLALDRTRMYGLWDEFNSIWKSRWGYDFQVHPPGSKTAEYQVTRVPAVLKNLWDNRELDPNREYDGIPSLLDIMDFTYSPKGSQYFHRDGVLRGFPGYTKDNPEEVFHGEGVLAIIANDPRYPSPPPDFEGVIEIQPQPRPEDPPWYAGFRSPSNFGVHWFKILKRKKEPIPDTNNGNITKDDNSRLLELKISDLTTERDKFKGDLLIEKERRLSIVSNIESQVKEMKKVSIQPGGGKFAKALRSAVEELEKMIAVQK